ncbi:MAG: LamG-like jellyroll fold domain-containing protein [Polyangiales bacterium]
MTRETCVDRNQGLAPRRPALGRHAPVTLGRWTNFATVHDGATQTQTLYIDGVLAVVPVPPYPASAPNPEALASPSVGGQGILYLAQEPSINGYDGLMGQMDEVRTYNVALTQAQIKLDMQ